MVKYDFLGHLDETGAGRKQRGTSGSAFWAIRAVGDERRYVMVTLPPSEVQFMAEIPAHATFSFGAARENAEYTGEGSLQVWIQTAGGERRIVYSRDLEGRIDGWIENRLDLNEYAGRRVSVVLRTVDPSSCCNYFWADPVLIAPNEGSHAGEALKSNAKEPNPLVLGGKATPAHVAFGQLFDMTFSGAALTSELYFDIRYLAPQVSGSQEAFNWQHGASDSHSVALSTASGKWIITGVRAHRDPWDHNGVFNPVSIVLEVTR